MNDIGNSPAIIRKRPKAPPPPKKHDGLCITQTQEYGMVYCWCTKPCCWHGEGQIKQKRRRTPDENGDTMPPPRLKGRCICRECPCHDPVFLLPSGLISTSFPHIMNAPPPPATFRPPQAL